MKIIPNIATAIIAALILIMGAVTVLTAGQEGGQDALLENERLQGAVDALTIFPNGNISMGTSDSDMSLHVHRTDGTSRIRVSDSSYTSSQQILFELTGQGNPQFRLFNNHRNKVWNFRTQDYGECSTGNTCFIINKRNGARFGFRENGNMFIPGSYESGSSRKIKANVTSIDSEELLSRVRSTPVYEWSYGASADIRHIGPMAEDFYSSFGLGSGDEVLSPSNVAGVTLAAVQALEDRNQRLVIANLELSEKTSTLERKNQELVRNTQKIEERLAKVEELLGTLD